jgi:1-acyl-sn-glycerol-3-phosphate acyltransferase
LRVKKFLFWPYQLYAWLILFPLAGIITLMAGWIAVLVAVLVNPRFASRHIAMNWARLLAFLTPMRVKVEGAEHVDKRRSFVVVSNHVSMFDILALYGWLDLDLKWVIKQELRKMPGVGIGCEKLGHIFVERQRPELARRAVNEALDRLGDGIGILFFAEGTRSMDGRLLPFKKGAFRIAIEQQLPLLPVTLVGTREIMPSKSLCPYPGRVRVVAHEPIDTSDMRVEDLERLMMRTHAAIASALPVDLQG